MWQPISTAPRDRDLQLAVIAGGEAHALVFPCRRAARGWVKANTNEAVRVSPTHWRDWEERNEAEPGGGTRPAS